jgi:hypothetical protein
MISLHYASCIDWLANYDGPLFDACVTDPPYHLTTGKKGGIGEASVNLSTPAGRARPGRRPAAKKRGVRRRSMRVQITSKPISVPHISTASPFHHRKSLKRGRRL